MGEIESPQQIVVCDAGPVIHLDELACVDLLSDFPQVWVAPTVWREVERYRPAALVSPNFNPRESEIALQMLPEVDKVARRYALHCGELESLHLALRHSADLFLTDDTAARLASNELAIPVHGTIGILLRSIRRGQRTQREMLSVLRSLPLLSSLHLKSSLLDDVIREVEQMD